MITSQLVRKRSVHAAQLGRLTSPTTGISIAISREQGTIADDEQECWSGSSRSLERFLEGYRAVPGL